MAGDRRAGDPEKFVWQEGDVTIENGEEYESTVPDEAYQEPEEQDASSL